MFIFFFFAFFVGKERTFEQDNLLKRKTPVRLRPSLID